MKFFEFTLPVFGVILVVVMVGTLAWHFAKKKYRGSGGDDGRIGGTWSRESDRSRTTK